MSDLSAFSLAGKRIMVTGANTGIGLGIAVAIARAGGAVIGVGRSAMDETAGMVDAEGVRRALSQAKKDRTPEWRGTEFSPGSFTEPA